MRIDYGPPGSLVPKSTRNQNVISLTSGVTGMLLILIFSGPYSANRLVTELTGQSKKEYEENDKSIFTDNCSL